MRLYRHYRNYRSVSRVLNISTSTLHRWVHTGIQKMRRPKQHSTQFLLLQQHVRDYLLQQPFTTILSIVHYVQQTVGIRVSTKTMGKYLRMLAFSKKKAFHQTAKDIDPQVVMSFKHTRERLNQQSRVFYSVDECYFSERILPSYGYSPVGIRLHSTLKPRKWDKRSLLMAVGSNGSIHYKVIQGSVKHTNFKEFILEGWCQKEDVILLDNVSFHRSVAKDLDEQINFLFIPPYSPQYNPVEYCFSKIKGCFRALMALSYGLALEDTLGKAIHTLTPSDIINTFQHSFKI
jgi:transposase